MLKRIHLDNYKCFVNFDIEFGRINLILGANGAGKTGLFEVIRRLCNLLTNRAKIENLFPTSSLTRWDNRAIQTFEPDPEGNGGIYRYRLEIEHNLENEPGRIKEEKLYFDGKIILSFESLPNYDHPAEFKQSSFSMNQTIYEQIGGEQVVRRLVDRFYDLMDTLPEAAGIRSLHPESLEHSRDKLFMFLSGWMGGPPLYIERFGHPRLRARHLPFPIGESERDQWLLCMRQALDETEMDPLLRHQIAGSFAQLADFMRNQGV